MRFKYLTFVCALFLFSCSFGQVKGDKGEIYLENDTISALIEYQNTNKYYTSINTIDDAGNKKTYGVGDIKGYKTPLGLYVSTVTDTTFVKALLVSEVNLYVYKNLLIAQKGLEAPVVLENEKESNVYPKWKRVVSYLVSDCLNNESAIKELKLNSESLLSLFREYRLCLGNENTLQYLAKPDKARFRLGFLGGVNMESIDITSEEVDYKDDISEAVPTFGVNLLWDFPSISGLTLGLGFRGTSFNSSFVIRDTEFNTSGFQIERIGILDSDLTNVSIPVFVNVNLFTKGANSLEAQLGFGPSFYTSPSFVVTTKETRTSITGDVFTSEEPLDLVELKASQSFVFGGIGYFRNLKFGQAGVSLRYENTLLSENTYESNNQEVLYLDRFSILFEFRLR